MTRIPSNIDQLITRRNARHRDPSFSAIALHAGVLTPPRVGTANRIPQPRPFVPGTSRILGATTRTDRRYPRTTVHHSGEPSSPDLAPPGLPRSNPTMGVFASALTPSPFWHSIRILFSKSRQTAVVPGKAKPGLGSSANEQHPGVEINPASHAGVKSCHRGPGRHLALDVSSRHLPQ